uniref:Longistatin n=1 Tax=Scytodes thoracica TaxID=1112478 RepID=A0A0A0VC43_SCYTH|nr:longistatin [Scytodes thoracica]
MGTTTPLRWTLLWFAVIVLCDRVSGHSSAEADELRKKWGAKDIIRDVDHIREDVKKMNKLQDAGELTLDEGLFYFLRMHDFDENEKMDGIEFMTAIQHTMEHHADIAVDFKQMIDLVDTVFQYDDNADGFISYSELRTHIPNK